MISLADFQKVEITVGKILSAERVPETEKLLKLSVDFGLSPLEKGVPNSDSGRVVTTPAHLNESPPLLRGITPALQESGTRPTGPPKADGQAPFGKGDESTTTPLRNIRQIISGIAFYFPDPAVLVGKKCMFVTNLESRVIRGLESNGMLLAVSTEDGKFSLLEPMADIPEGTRAK